MTGLPLRPIVAPLAGVLMCFLISPLPGAAVGDKLVAHYTARAVDVADTTYAGRIDILIERWSTDAERQGLADALARGGPAQLFSALHHTPRVGVLLMPGVQGHGARARTRTPRNLLFAREVSTPGGRHLVVASEEHLGLGEPALDARKTIDEFNLMEIRFGADGTGIGKIAAADDVIFGTETGVLQVKDYASRPVRVTDVKSEGR